jgi:hypothetical protein
MQEEAKLEGIVPVADAEIRLSQAHSPTVSHPGQRSQTTSRSRAARYANART